MISGCLCGLSAGNPSLIAKQYCDWSNTANPTVNIFNYGYDKLNRLGLAATTAGVSMSEALTYDVMGNIASLNRDGAGATVYNYYNSGSSNRLQSVSGLTTQNYEYDANGNATKDGLSGISLTYNYLNLPATAVRTTGSVVNLSYTYDATGNKLVKNSSGTVRNYVNGIEYKPDGTTIDIIHTEEGIARNSGGTYSYEYNLSDHLGNVRATFYKNPITNQLEVLQQDNYYAFGLRKEPVVKEGTNKYLYNGKELQEELGQYDYGARFYDPVIGRWNVVDPLAETFENVSPYNYGLNNPIIMIDPNGRETKSTHTDKLGNVLAVYNDGDLGVYKHKNAKSKEDVDEERKETKSTSGGGKKMGETEYWDEFMTIGKDRHPEGRIRFGETWDKDIDTYNKYANEQDLSLTAEQSRNNRRFDIKVQDYLAPDGVMTGKLLDGKYASARSAGNYLAGLNGRTGTFQGQHISLDTYMKLAGALNQKKFSGFNAFRIVAFGTAFGPAPYFGEDAYSGRMILKGWNSNR